MFCALSPFCALPWRQDGVKYFLRLLVLLLLDIPHVSLCLGRGRHGSPAAYHGYSVLLAGFGCADLCLQGSVEMEARLDR